MNDMKNSKWKMRVYELSTIENVCSFANPAVSRRTADSCNESNQRDQMF